ncbi:MAG: hypothetical protein H7332_09090 [Bdellovibrionales bacterium]|nr:hypothetical protein [Ramlibacter sp.]
MTKIVCMNIHQLSVNYIQEQDRILVRINTSAGEELRLWFTRRLTLNLWPMLTKIVADQVLAQEAVKDPGLAPVIANDAQTRKMVAEFKKEENLQNADFKTPYKEPAALPLGADPLLVTEVNVTPLPTGQLQLSFAEKLPGAQNPRGFQMALESQMTHGLVHLLEKALNTSLWREVHGVAASAQTPQVPEEPPAGDKPKYLN